MKDKRADIIGVPISAVNMESCVDYIYDNMDEGRGSYICVSNVHTTVMAHDNPEYMKVQSESFLSIPDGKPLSIVGRKQFPEMDRVTGPDLMRRVFTDERFAQSRHYFYGNTKDNLEKLIEVLRAEYPKLNIVGYAPSVFRALAENEESEFIDNVNSLEADFVWVGLGAPRQENFCYKLKGRANGIMIGVGGAFNVLAGIVPEAPMWMQNMSLEWLYRLIQEPRRLFKRYLVTNTKFIWYLIRRRD